MFRDSERSAGDQAVFDSGARARRDRLLLIAIGLLMPALLIGPGLLAPAPESVTPANHLGAGRDVGGGEASVSSAGWHPAIEHVLGPIGPVPGEGLGRPGD
jgi:hypothetical protein